LHSPVEPAGAPAGACAKLLAASSIPAASIVIVDSDFIVRYSINKDKPTIVTPAPCTRTLSLSVIAQYRSNTPVGP
jgi:hypothetical protein